MKKSTRLILLILGTFLSYFAFSCGHSNQNAFAQNALLQLSVDFENELPMSQIEAKLSVESSSKLTMVKYAYARVAKSYYFTKYEKNGITITKNSSGEYVFPITKNGYISVFAKNADGEEKLLVFKVSNIDTITPKLEIKEQRINNTLYAVELTATDDGDYPVIIQYLNGAYASKDDPVWTETEQFQNFHSLTLQEGKYTFKVTDAAENTEIIIRYVGNQEKQTKEFRAVWISYLEFKTTGYTKKQFTTHIKKMFQEVAAMNMNAVVVHVRPFGDAMYPSNYFPWSKYVSGKQGEAPGFDPLKIMVEEAHALGLEFHAWLNPYRVTSNSTDVTKLSKDNPARVFRTDSNKNNDRNVLTYSGSLYYNPSVKGVRTLLINGIKEIVRNYDVDGIHFDDYFYPSLGKNFTINFDAKEYETYKKNQITKKQPYLSIADWRRENVNTLIRDVYAAIKKIDKDVVFGISPGGFMDALKADDKYYVDFETWLGYDGYIDYLCPQLYWSNDHSSYPYDEILKRFVNAAVNPDVKLYVGVAAYKAGLKTEGTAWYKNTNVLRNMIKNARKTNRVDGFILYRYEYLISKRDHSAIKNMLKEF